MRDIIEGDWDDSDVVATEEELIANEVGFVQGPAIQCDGKMGRFINTATKEETPVVRGVVLAKFQAQLGFGGDSSQNFSDFDGWFCRNDYKEKAKPRVNEQAPKRILQRLQQLGGGVSCAGCPLRQFGEPDEHGKEAKPDCGTRWVLVWLDDRYDDPMPLFIKGKSIKPMHDFLKGDDFKVKSTGQLQPSMIRRIELTMEKEGKGVNTYYVVKFRALGKVASRQEFVRLREDGLNSLRVYAQNALAAPRPNLLALTAGPEIPERVASADDPAATQVFDWDEIPQEAIDAF